MRLSIAFSTLLAAVAVAHPIQSRAPLSPDPAGTKNVGNGAGTQFITGQCLSNADCASACCATLGSIGICSGPGAQFQQGKTGCGFNSGGSSSAAPPPPPAAVAPPASADTSSSGSGLKPDPAGVPHIGNGKGEQFITGQCLSNADCNSACCATLGSIGICSGPGAQFQQGKTGCGFNSSGSAAAAAPPAAAPAAVAPPAQTENTGSGLKPDPAGVPHIGNGKGEQFITGQCLSNADCNSACCATLGSIGICSGPGAQFQQGKTGCGFNSSNSSSSVAPPAAAPAAVAPPAQTENTGSSLKPDPAGVPHVGNGKGEQFITGQCLSDADCNSACCATLGSIGICSGPGAAFQQGKTGCGFKDSSAASAAPPAAPAAVAPPAQGATTGSGLKPDPAGAKNVGNGVGAQFITGQCLSNADCGSACCATLGSIGICSGPGAQFQQGKTGCGFKSN